MAALLLAGVALALALAPAPPAGALAASTEAGRATAPTGQPAAAPAPFPDVAGTWAEGVVRQAVALGLVSGYPDGTFAPDRPVSRAEFIKMVARAAGLTPVPGDAGFADVGGSWVATQGYLLAAVDAGLVVPSDYGSPPELRPDQPISRLQVAVIAARFLREQGAAMVLRGTALPFADAAAIPRWASGAVAVAASTGTLGGFPDGSFGPDRPLTRAQAAAVVVRLVRAAVAEGLMRAPAGLSQPPPARQVPVWEASSWTVSTPPAPAGLPGTAANRRPAGATFVASVPGSGGALDLVLGSDLWHLAPGGGRATLLYHSPDGNLGPVAAAPGGRVYVARGHRVLAVSGGGATPWAGGATAFFADGPGAQAGFDAIDGMCAEANGDLYVAGLQTLRKIDARGDVTTIAGLTPLEQDALTPSGPPPASLLPSGASPEGAAEGPGYLTPLPVPASIACGPRGDVYLAGGTDVLRVDAAGRVTWLAGGPRGYADGLAAEAQFRGITAIAADRWGDVWIADAGSQRIRRLTPDGHVYTVAGGGLTPAPPSPPANAPVAPPPLPGGLVVPYRAADRNGPGPEARFNDPVGLAVSGGSLYVLQGGGSLLRRIDGSLKPYPAGEALAALPGAGLAPALEPLGGDTLGQAPAGPVDVPLGLYTPVENVRLAVDGRRVARGGDPAYTMTWDAGGASTGPHTLLAEGRLPGGGWLAGAPATLTVTPAPAGGAPGASTALLAPGNGSWLRGTVKVAALGDGQPLRLLLDGRTVARGDGRVLTYRWDTRTAADGVHTIEVASGAGGRPAGFAVVHVANGGLPAPADNGAWLRVEIGGRDDPNLLPPPRLVKGVPYLPFTATLRDLGFLVNWSGASRTLLVWRAGSDFRLTLHEDTGVVDAPSGRSTLSPPPVDDHNNILVPYTFFAAVGHTATYDPARHLVDIAGTAAFTAVGSGSAGGGG